MTALPSVNWSYPTAVRFGAGRIKELPAVSSTGKDGATASSRIFQITRAQSEDKANNWQATITITGARVSYSLVTVAETYKFSDAQLAQVADRIAVRLTQAG